MAGKLADAPELNGVQLTSLEAVEEAFSHLADDYNSGEIKRTLGGEHVILWSRYRSCEHMSTLLEASEWDGGITIVDVYPDKLDGEWRTKIKLTSE